jgi:hypothetical protein
MKHKWQKESQVLSYEEGGRYLPLNHCLGEEIITEEKKEIYQTLHFFQLFFYL